MDSRSPARGAVSENETGNGFPDAGGGGKAETPRLTIPWPETSVDAIKTQAASSKRLLPAFPYDMFLSHSMTPLKSALIMLCFCLSPLYCQLDRGTLTGTVKDPTGAAIAGAKVTAVQKATNVDSSTTTTHTGDYTLPALPIGNYAVTAEAAGFKRAVQPGVTLSSGSTLRLDFTVELGTVAESVEVRGQATSLETETTRVATNLMSVVPVVGGDIVYCAVCNQPANTLPTDP